MQLRTLGLSSLLLALAISATAPSASAQAPGDAKLDALNGKAISLYKAGKTSDAIPLAKRFAAAMKARHGENSPQYAVAISNLAQLLKATNQLADAERLYRRALAIDEKSYGTGHREVATDLTNLAKLLSATNRADEAEALYRRALAIDEKSYGPSHPSVATDIDNLAALLWNTNRLGEAENLFRRALAINEKIYGGEHPKVGESISNLAVLLRGANRLGEAEALYRRVLAIVEKRYGPDHPNVATSLNDLAELFRVTNRFAEAERLLRRALAIDEKSYGSDHTNVARHLIHLAGTFSDTNRLDEAEPLYRRALAIEEKSYGPDHPKLATCLNNLAELLRVTRRLTEAEALYRRALAIEEKSNGPDRPNVATTLNNLALLLLATNRPAEAEPLMHRALAIDEKSYGPVHPKVATSLNNLAQLFQATNRLEEAEAFYRRTLTIDEKSYGPDHPDVATSLNNLAALLSNTNRLAEAEPLMRRALAIDEKSYGPGHPHVARDIANLAVMRQEQNDWPAAAAFCLRAKHIRIGTHVSRQMAGGTMSRVRIAEYSGSLRNCARVLYRADVAANRAEGFALAQWALQNAAADALTSMSLRFATGNAQLARLVRDEQDLRHARDGTYRLLDAAIGKADAKAAEAARGAIAKIEEQLAAKQAELRRQFPDYAMLAVPHPLALAEAQAILGEGRALVMFLDLPQIGRIQEETLVFAINATEARWLSIPLGRDALRERVTTLRCGLDTSTWEDGRESRQVCRKLLGTEVSDGEHPPFDATLAHALYRDLFGGIEDAIKNKSLLIVPSGPLTQLPFEVLVTREPDKSAPRFQTYKKAEWLGQRQAITVLPSVGSLRALHTAKSSAATAPFIGFGNPLLTGNDGQDRRAWAKQDCGKAAGPKQSRVASLIGAITSLFRGGAVNVEELRRQAPLPETADELCAVATGLGVPAADLDNAVHLGSHATVTQVKALSASGELARARVVHFATHGLIAGETAMFTQEKAEPALLMTPPAADKASVDDNGLLTASEVAQLKLNADWVIMSACNTAAGADGGAEALSGLARAFFYAGARSLLVSHWYVNSDAAVAITTGAINAMKADPKTGRAEALRRSLTALIAKGNGWDHPSIWAPFVLVGNGEQ